MKKVLNVLGIIMAWLLSIVLVLMLIVTPLAFSAVSLLKVDTITKVVTNMLASETAATQPGENWEVTRLAETAVTESTTQDAGKSVLEGMFGDQVTPEQMSRILNSDVVREFLETYTEDVVNGLVDNNKAPQMDAEKIKRIVQDNIDEVVEILREVVPDCKEMDTEELKSGIMVSLDNGAEELAQALPKPEEFRQELVESNPKLEMALKLFAQRDRIKLAIIGVIVVISGLIFLCRLCDFRGFRWLATDLFVGGGFGLLTSIGLLVSASAVDVIAVQSGASIAMLVETLLSAFTTGMFIRTAVMLAAGGGLLTLYILLKKHRAKKALLEEMPVVDPELLKDEKLDIIIVAGQSNAQGRGLGAARQEYVPDERILAMTDDANPKYVTRDGVPCLELKQPANSFVTLAHENVINGERVGCFALQFAKRYVTECLEPERKVLLVNANCGGTGFARPEWGVGNCMHERLITMSKEALSYNPENRIVAMLWSQGEHDAFENADWEAEKRHTVHKKNLSETLEDFYTRVGDRTVPFIACGFCSQWCGEHKEATDAVLKAIQECCEAVDGGFVDTAGLLSNSQKIGGTDNLHFCRASLYDLGNRFYEKFKEFRK